MNGRYLRELDVDDLTGAPGGADRARPGSATRWRSRRTRSARWPSSGRSRGFFFDGPADDPAARERVLEAPGGREALARRGPRSSSVPEPWTEENVQAALDGVADRLGVKRKQVFQPLRVAVAGTTVSPGIFETVALLGRDETLARVDHALNGRKGT